MKTYLTIYLLLSVFLLAACQPSPDAAMADTKDHPDTVGGGPMPTTTQPTATPESEEPQGSDGQGLVMLDPFSNNEPEDLSSAPRPEVVWNAGNEASILSATFCCGYTSESTAINYIPEAQIWGDGRMIWTRINDDGSRTVLEGHLTVEELTALLQRFVDAGFFGMKDRYENLSVSDMADKCLRVRLLGTEKQVCEYYQGAPPIFHELFDVLASGAGLTGKNYVPESGYLAATSIGTVGEVNLDQAPLAWEAAEMGISLSKAENGAWIEGNALTLAWEAVNANFWLPILQEGENYYQITLQIPGVSMQSPPPRR